jgi:hypothetical protein
MVAEFNMREIEAEAYQIWRQERAPKRSTRDLFEASVPYWIVIVGVGLYLLSAPHTAGVFNDLTPGWGGVAPLVVEFGLLYAAFRRKVARGDNDGVPPMLTALQALLFITAVLVNGAGAFTAVVKSAGIGALSFTEIGNQFTSFPATTQASLVMSLLAAFIVPIGALAAGEGFATLILSRRAGSFLEQHWRAARQEMLYQTLYSKVNGAGLPAMEAAKLARSEVRGYLSPGRKLAATAPGAENEDTGNSPENAGIPENSGIPNYTGLANGSKKRSKGEAIKQLESLYGELSGELPPVAEIVQRTGIGKSTVYEWVKAKKQSQGG